MRTRTHQQNGFTLTELVLIIVIVGIMAAVALPRFFERQSFDVRAIADQTRSMLRYAQKNAVAQNRPVYVTLTGNRTALCYGGACSAATLPANMVLAPGGSNSGSTSTTTACVGSAGYNSSWYCEAMPAGVNSATAPNTASFYFDALGQPYAAADPVTTTISTFATLSVTISGGTFNQSVAVERDTGYVH